MCEVARRCGADVVRVDEEWGTPLDPQRLLDAQREHPHARLVAVVHAETSTGVENDIAPLAALRDTDTLLLVDTVTSLGGIPVEIDGWGVDASYSGTQKCLGVPPGPLAGHVLARGPSSGSQTRALPPQSWYLDLSLIANYVDGASRVYHHTAPVSMVFSLHAALGALLDEGLEAAWARHRAVGTRLQRALPELGFRLVVPDGHRLPELTTAWLPDGADDADAAQGAARHLRHRGGRRARRVRRARRGASASWATRRASARSPRCSARCASCSADGATARLGSVSGAGSSMCSR